MPCPVCRVGPCAAAARSSMGPVARSGACRWRSRAFVGARVWVPLLLIVHRYIYVVVDVVMDVDVCARSLVRQWIVGGSARLSCAPHGRAGACVCVYEFC